MKKIVFIFAFIPSLASAGTIVTQGTNMTFTWSTGTVVSVPSYCGGYSHQRQITISSTNVANVFGTLSNFPVLISTNDVTLSTTTASGGHLSTGYDLVFSTDSNCQFKVNWDTETVMNVGVSTMNVWVRVPTLSTATATAATLYMTYGNAAITSYQGFSTATWDSNYVGVYHLSNGVALSTADSTSNGNTGTISGATAAVGFIDGAAGITGTTPYIGLPTSSVFDPFATFTASAWVNMTSFGAAGNGLYTTAASLNSGIFYVNSSGNESYYYDGVVFNGATTLSVNTWYYLTVTNSGAGGTMIGYVNGVQDGTGPQVNTNSGTILGVQIGTNQQIQSINGVEDQFEYSSTARNSDWIKTEYNNQHSPQTFVTIGAEH